MFWWLLCDGTALVSDHEPALYGPRHMCVRFGTVPLCNDESELS